MTGLRRRAALSRRRLLGAGAGIAGLGLGAILIGGGLLVPRVQAAAPADLGVPQPEESIEETIARLFGDRELNDGAAMIDLDLPVIAENGAVVPARIEAALPMQADDYVQGLYILIDKNRRPMAAHYSFTPAAGAALIATRLRLGATSPVRAVAEMSDGTLYQAMREVRVTIGGCGG